MEKGGKKVKMPVIPLSSILAVSIPVIAPQVRYEKHPVYPPEEYG